MKKKKIALLGFGNAGKAFGRLLVQKREEIAKEYNVDVSVIAVTTATRGNLVNPKGIDLERAIEDLEKKGRFTCAADLSDMSNMDVVQKTDYDVLVEMTPLNIFTGQPAISHIEGALSRGRDVVTANKGPIAWKYRELKKAAEKTGAKLFFETTVMDGTPVFNLVEKTLKLAEVTEVSGILNSTTNFILEELAAGKEYEDIMKEGRQRGFIEADPAMDIEGYDAAGKITALLNVLMDAHITPDMVERKGIEDITVADIKAAAERGCVIKLICRGYRDENDKVIATVQPEEIPAGDMLASVDSTTSVISITTDMMKKISIVEHAPEIEQTAYGIFSDLLRALDE